MTKSYVNETKMKRKKKEWERIGTICMLDRGKLMVVMASRGNPRKALGDIRREFRCFLVRTRKKHDKRLQDPLLSGSKNLFRRKGLRLFRGHNFFWPSI